MTTRHFPVRPDFDQLKRQAKEMLLAVRNGEQEALTEFHTYSPHSLGPTDAKLVHAQTALARAYGIPSWNRLKLACRMTEAIWNNDADTVRDLVLQLPRLLQCAGSIASVMANVKSHSLQRGQDLAIREANCLSGEIYVHTI